MDDRIQYLKELLVDEQVSYFGRISNMLCVGFGEALKLKNYNGNTVTKSSIALHIQAAWRIISNSKILIASSDFYTPNSKLNSSEDFEYGSTKIRSLANGSVSIQSQNCLNSGNRCVFL